MADANTNSPQQDPEFVKFACEVLQKGLWEGSNLLTKGMTFCLAITAGLVGYVVTKNLPSPVVQMIVGAGIGTLLLFSILAAHWISGIITTVNALEQLVESLAPELYKKSPVPPVFAKMRSVRRTFAVCAILEIGMLASGMAALLLYAPARSDMGSLAPPADYVAPSPIKDSSAKGAVNEGNRPDNTTDKRGGTVRPDRR